MNIKTLFRKLSGNKMVYPEGGEVFEARGNVDISYLTHFMAPYTGGGRGILLKGERIIVSKPDRARPKSYFCYPVNVDVIERRVVAAKDRDEPTYNGFSLMVDTLSLNRDFEKIALTPIHYVKGDATSPTGTGVKIIVHICNDVGGWGRGFVLAISKKWKQPEAEYRNWFKNQEGIQSDTVQFERLGRRDEFANEKKFALGNVQFVKTADDIWVANLLAQRDTKPNKDGTPPIRYAYVSECLDRVAKFARRYHACVHMPRIGCGLAGGQWTEIEEIINHSLIAHEVETTVCWCAASLRSSASISCCRVDLG